MPLLASPSPASSPLSDRSLVETGLIESGLIPSGQVESWSPAWQAGALDRIAADIGAQRQHDQGCFGAGISVAVIDTGIAVTPLRGGRRLAPTLSVDMRSASAEIVEAADLYGHGTHLAGIVAGIAPAAPLVAVNVADATGGTDRNTVAAGVDWVVEHAATHGVRVILLAYSDDPNLVSSDDPLLRSVERAWNSGLVVIAAGGNEGHDSNGLTAPATSHSTIAVTAAEPVSDRSFDSGTTGRTEYRLAPWASGGNHLRRADVAAPGTSVEGARSPGSMLDRSHPEGRDGISMFRGTGSSQAAAVVAGAVALLLCEHPSLTPDEVKAQIIASAAPLDGGDGVGLLRLGAAAPATSGTRWSGTRWSGTRWSGTRWSGTRWSGTRWS